MMRFHCWIQVRYYQLGFIPIRDFRLKKNKKSLTVTQEVINCAFLANDINHQMCLSFWVMVQLRKH